MPRVTIVSPTYNHEAFIAECIQSAISQTFPDWEMIVVDDGSTDNTLDIARSFDDPRIIVLTQANQGLGKLSQTYNSALSKSQGEFVAILEGDDYWPKNKLELQVPRFEDKSVVLVSGNRRIVDGEGMDISLDLFQPSTSAKSNDPIGAGTLALMDHRSLTFAFPVATMLRRSALDSMGGFYQPEYLPLVDLPTFVRISRYGHFAWIDQECGTWRRHESSTTKSRLPEILDGVHRFAGEWLEHEAREFAFEDETLTRWMDSWGAFMVHRCVLLSLILTMEGDRQGAIEASRMAMSFRGPLKRRAKSFASLVAAFARLGEAKYRKLTSLGNSSNLVPPHESLVGRGSLKRIQTWPK